MELELVISKESMALLWLALEKMSDLQNRAIASLGRKKRAASYVDVSCFSSSMGEWKKGKMIFCSWGALLSLLFSWGALLSLLFSSKHLYPPLFVMDSWSLYEHLNRNGDGVSHVWKEKSPSCRANKTEEFLFSWSGLSAVRLQVLLVSHESTCSGGYCL